MLFLISCTQVLEKEYYKTGELKKEKIGTEQEYKELFYTKQKEIYKITNYKNGVLHGKQEHIYISPLHKKISGETLMDSIGLTSLVLYKFYMSGDTIKIIDEFKCGERDGLRKQILNNIIIEKDTYRNGFLHGRNFTNFRDGTLRSELEWYKDTLLYQKQFLNNYSDSILFERRGVYIDIIPTDSVYNVKLILGGPVVTDDFPAYFILSEQPGFQRITQEMLYFNNFKDTVFSLPPLEKGNYIIHVYIEDLAKEYDFFSFYFDKSFSVSESL